MGPDNDLVGRLIGAFPMQTFLQDSFDPAHAEHADEYHDLKLVVDKPLNGTDEQGLLQRALASWAPYRCSSIPASSPWKMFELGEHAGTSALPCSEGHRTCNRRSAALADVMSYGDGLDVEFRSLQSLAQICGAR